MPCIFSTPKHTPAAHKCTTCVGRKAMGCPYCNRTRHRTCFHCTLAEMSCTKKIRFQPQSSLAQKGHRTTTDLFSQHLHRTSHEIATQKVKRCTEIFENNVFQQQMTIMCKPQAFALTPSAGSRPQNSDEGRGCSLHKMSIGSSHIFP